MLAFFHRPIRHPLSFESHPVDLHLLHVRFGQSTGVLSLGGGHLRDLFPRVLPLQTGESRPRIAGSFRVKHHLPESFHAGIALAVQRERRGCEVGENSQFVPLRKNHLSRQGRLRQDFPIQFAGFGNGRPPVRRIRRLSLGHG